MIKIDKTISRDIPLSNIYAWHLGYTEGMQEWLGWSYSDALFYVHDGYVDIMRSPVEHLEIFRDVILKKIDMDLGWFESECRTFLKLVDEIEQFHASIDANLLKADNLYLVGVYEKYVDYITRIVGPYITMIWFPIWLENDIDAQEKYSAEIALAVDARKRSEQVFPQGDELIMKILSCITSKIDINITLAKMIGHDELVNYLKKGEAINISELKKRKGGFIYSKKGILFVENETQKIQQAFALLGYEYVIEDTSNVMEIKGNVACPGKIQGIVRVIMSKDKISEVIEGDVLVASMTTPEYLPAMKKASAFITDEGGITCHAAIVARELKKPCIIGTKIATQVLKDGDLVEVDADAGVVKIIKKART